jgi:hypothetical protein
MAVERVASLPYVREVAGSDFGFETDLLASRVFCGFPLSLQGNSGLDRLLPHPFLFIIHSTSS